MKQTLLFFILFFLLCACSRSEQKKDMTEPFNTLWDRTYLPVCQLIAPYEDNENSGLDTKQNNPT